MFCVYQLTRFFERRASVFFARAESGSRDMKLALRFICILRQNSKFSSKFAIILGDLQSNLDDRFLPFASVAVTVIVYLPISDIEEALIVNLSLTPSAESAR